MSQNTEQNVRTREEIETEIQRFLTHGVRGPNAAWQIVHRIFDEVRAYGAAEQRRKDAALTRAQHFLRDQAEAQDRLPERDDIKKWQEDQSEFFTATILEIVCEYAAWRDARDAEGQEPVAWVQPSALPSQDYPWYETELHIEQSKTYSLALYTRPANVAALEVRIAELETRAGKDQEVIHWLAEKLKQTDPGAKADYELLARAALTREGGV